MEYNWFKIVDTQRVGYAVLYLSDPWIFSTLMEYDSIYRTPLLVECDKDIWREFHPRISNCPGARDYTMVVLLARTCKKVFNLAQNYMNPCAKTLSLRELIFKEFERRRCAEERALAAPKPKVTVINLVSESDSDSDEIMEDATPEVVSLTPVAPDVEYIEDLSLQQFTLPVQNYRDFDPCDVYLL